MSQCVLKNDFGKGCTYYLASDPDDHFLDDFYENLLRKYAIAPALRTPKDVEVTVRRKDGSAILFVLNHNPAPISFGLETGTFRNLITNEPISNQLTLGSYGVRILIEQA